MMQHYMEQINNYGLFTMEQMIHWEDYNEECKTVLETTTYFEELVGSINNEKNTRSVEQSQRQRCQNSEQNDYGQERSTKLQK